MNITLSNLPIGKWRYFTPEEIKTMDQLVAGSSKTAGGENAFPDDMQEWDPAFSPVIPINIFGQLTINKPQ